MPKNKKLLPPQHQHQQPGRQYKSRPQPRSGVRDYKGCRKLRDRVAIISGGDSGIVCAVAVLFAKEGADISVVYLEEHKDAQETQRMVEQEGRKCLLIDGHVGDEKFCQKAVRQTASEFGRTWISLELGSEPDWHIRIWCLGCCHAATF